MSKSVSENQTQAQQTASGFVWELIRTGLIVLLIVLPIRLFVAQPFIVSGASMQPTFSSGDYLIIDQLSYRFNKPQRKDVVVFRYPKNPSKFYIKRIIGLPGETVKIEDSGIRISNDNNPDGFVLDEPYLQSHDTDSTKNVYTLDDDEYFVLGDNRSSSSDSRTWGTLPRRFIAGQAFLQLLPPKDVAVTPGDTENKQTEKAPRGP
jgi:signal peptidase I